MKILEICPFSEGICGVWSRVKQESIEFSKKGYDISVFSSNEMEDGGIVEKSEEILEGIKIKRFPVTRKQGYALWFDFKEEALKLKPDVIICHCFRKPYLGPAIKIARKLGSKIFLVTHAPFAEKDMRSSKLNFIISLYDKFYAKKILNSFDKVISICGWEKKYLLDLGCDEGRIDYIPNLIPDDFFNKSMVEEKNKILYLGRLHQVKEIEILIEAFKKSDLNKDYILEIVGPKQGEYYERIKKLEEKNIVFLDAIYNIDKKIEKIDQAKIFVLPSKKEGLPLGLVEAMARGKIVISSKSRGAKELIKDCKNGFLFEIGNSTELQLIMDAVEKMSVDGKESIKNEAMKTTKKFKSSDAIKNWETFFK